MQLSIQRLSAITLALSLTAARPLLAEDSSSLASLFSSLTKSATTQGDSTLQSLSRDLQSKATALDKSVANNSAAKSGLESALESLVSGKSADSLKGLQKLSAAKLTPDQTKLAGDVFHIGTAYVIQKDFSSLDGAQSDVANAVKALRKGDAVSALPAITSIAQNAKLTDPQKQLIQSVAAQYTPGGDSVNKAIKGIGGLPGFGK